MQATELLRLYRAKTLSLVEAMRGVGLIGAVELVEDKTKKESFDSRHAVGTKLAAFAQECGMILRPLRDSIAFSPPLVIGEDEIAMVLERFGGALDDTHAWLRAEGLA